MERTDEGEVKPDGLAWDQQDPELRLSDWPQAPRHTLANDREDAGLTPGQVVTLCATLGRTVTREQLGALEADEAVDPALATWLRRVLYAPLPDELRDACSAARSGNLAPLRELVDPPPVRSRRRKGSFDRWGRE